MDNFEENEAQADETESQQALVPLDVRQIEFYGDVITVALVKVGGRAQVYVVLRPLCQYLGLSWSSQLQRIREDDVLAGALSSVLLSNTEVHTQRSKQRYSMVALQLEFLPGWLFSFTPKRVRPDLRERITYYRRECYRVLWGAFQRGDLFPEDQQQVLVRTETTSGIVEDDPRIVALTEQINMLASIVSMLQDHRAALLAETRELAVVQTSQQQLLQKADDISAVLEYVVTLLEQLVRGTKETERQVAKIEAIDTRTQHLSPAHARKVQEIVDRIVTEIAQRRNQPPNYAAYYGRYKSHFRVGRYDQVPDERFNEVIEWLREELRRVTDGDLPEQGSFDW